MGMIKKLQEEKSYNIQFTDEERDEFGWEENQKFEVSCEEDGSIILKPFVKIEIDFEDFPKSALIQMIQESCEKDISINDVISDALVEICDQYNENNLVSNFSDVTFDTDEK